MNIYIKHLLALFLAALCFSACQNDDLEHNNYNKQLSADSEFIRLLDDSTQIAGSLNILANTSEVNLKWNVPGNCNIDTTVTKIKLSKGQGLLQVKWDKKMEEGVYGPLDMAYEGGVLISSGEQSMYIPLFWTEGLDSTKVIGRSQIATRTGNVLPRAASVTLHPSRNVILEEDRGGAVYVTFSETPVVGIDASDITSETNIDKTAIPFFLREEGFVNFNWTALGAPNFNFVRNVRFSASESAYIVANLTYRIPGSDEAIYNFVSSSPASGGTLSSKNASVKVVVYTNKEWSLESELNLIPPTHDPDAFGPENKEMTIPIQDNLTASSREVVIIVKSQDVAKDTLTFTQLGSGLLGVFEFISSVPAENTTIPGAATDIDVTVKTDQAWYIDCNVCTPQSFPAEALGEYTKTYTIPANTTSEIRIITITVSSGNPATEKKLQFVQLPQNGGGTDMTLNYNRSSLPTGNIPVAGSTYTFYFTGTYTGGVQVRALVDGVAQTPGASNTNKEPQCTVPANTLTITRNVTFEYKREDGDWTALPASTNRIQDTDNGGAPSSPITPGLILPAGNIPEEGGTYSCTFMGGPGNVILRAMKGNVRVAISAGHSVSPSTSTMVSIVVPALDNEKNTSIAFEYSTDGGVTWTSIASKPQVNYGLGVNVGGPTTIPAVNGSVTFSVIGNYPYPVTVYARYNGNIIGQGTASKAPGGIAVPIENNTTGTIRYVDFYYTRSSDNRSFTIGTMKQLGQ